MKPNLIEPIIGGPTPDHLILAVDFDGTICQHPGDKFPAIGDPVPHALAVLKRIQEAGHKIVLWTMRSTENGAQGDILWPAVEYLIQSGIQIWGHNENPEQSWSSSPKAYAHLYIDDAALGCPLVRPNDCRAFVNWWDVEDLLEQLGVLNVKRYPDFEIKYLLESRQHTWTADSSGENAEDAIAYLRHCVHPGCQFAVVKINGEPYQEPVVQEGGQAA